jgi:RNA polymerase sigma-70 factor, ECF subfamily
VTDFPRELAQRYPGVAFDPRLDVQPESPRRLEVYLCRAVEADDGLARVHFDRLYIEPLTLDDDVKQLLRHKLLLEGGRLSSYTGRGELAQWVKAIGARLRVDVLRAGREDAVEDRMLEALVPASANSELEHLKQDARKALRDALYDGLEALDSRERLFVQHYHLDGLTLTAIGEMYGVAPSTVMRALERARLRLKEVAHAWLAQTHGLSPTALDSLVRAAGSHFEP